MVGAGGAGFQMVQDIVALRTKNAEITGASNVLIFPLYFGSTAFLPHDLLPAWPPDGERREPGHLDAMRALMLQG
jgi:hypothetical protein